MSVRILQVLALALPILSLSTELKFSSPFPKEIQLIVTKANFEDLDVFRLTTSNRVEHDLVCADNPFFDERISRIEYKNYYGVRMDWFQLDDEMCMKFFRFLRSTFEGIDKDAPILIKLDVKSKKVKSISLPPLNPFEYGPEEKKNIELRPYNYKLSKISHHTL